MMWEALSRLVVVRLVLLVAIAAAGPAGAASSWHSLDSVEHRLGSTLEAVPPTLHAGALPPDASRHCPACEFGTALRAWTPTPTTGLAAPAPVVACRITPSATALHPSAAEAYAGRAPPRA